MNDEAIITVALVTAWGALLVVGSALFLSVRWLVRRFRLGSVNQATPKSKS